MRLPWGSRRRAPQGISGPPPRAVPFEGVLDEAIAENLPEVPLVAALARTRADLTAVDNMGRTADGRDLFEVVDGLAGAVSATYPQSLCRAGCGRCCEYPTAFFDLYEAEWELIARHVEAHWSPERRNAFMARFARTHGPHRWAVRLFGWLMTQSLPIFPTRVALPLSCPFIEDERCSVYRVRPLACRTFGSFTAKLTPWSPPHVYACYEQAEALEQAVLGAPLPVYLPDLAPFQWRQLGFVKGRKRVMADWIQRRWGERSKRP